MHEERRLPVGAELVSAGVDFRVWAPRRRRAEVMLEPEGRAVPLAPAGDGYFAATVEGLSAGALYRYRLDGEGPFPDPASRFQPHGVDGPSQVVDPTRFAWSDASWRGPRGAAPVYYEMHLGTFTREGTWAAAAARLPRLVELGIEVLEVMPVAEFAGDFGWGYDGVDLFAPYHRYGTPEDCRAFVDRAHGLGLGVILDVVYNHFGPRGCYLAQFSDSYQTDRGNEWGDAVNFDGAGSAGVRELVVANAGYWIDEFHFDGLRLDATHSLHDDSAEHIVAAIVRRAREAGGERRVLVVVEDEDQVARQLRPVASGGYGADAAWNDDFHHAARVAATGRREAFFTAFGGGAQELLSALRRGFLYQGQRSPWQGRPRGTPALDLPPRRFVCFLENHDQVANAMRGERLHRLVSPGRMRALTTMLLLAPSSPLLFQGQEVASAAPWVFFADHPGELGEQVRAGRLEFLTRFPSAASEEMASLYRDPGDRATFEACRLDLDERGGSAEAWALHRDLLRLRREDPTFAGGGACRLDGAVLSPHAFVARFFGQEGDDRLLLVNLAGELALTAPAEPLLAPPEGSRWTLAWSSEHPRYGGAGALPPEGDDGWQLPAEAALVLRAAPHAE